MLSQESRRTGVTRFDAAGIQVRLTRIGGTRGLFRTAEPATIDRPSIRPQHRLGSTETLKDLSDSPALTKNLDVIVMRSCVIEGKLRIAKDDRGNSS
jgi:hypothetical protein